MDNPRFVDEETIPLVQEDKYDNYSTPNTSKVYEKSFTGLDTTEASFLIKAKSKTRQASCVL